MVEESDEAGQAESETGAGSTYMHPPLKVGRVRPGQSDACSFIMDPTLNFDFFFARFSPDNA